MEGDEVSKRGAFTGGYRDERAASRIALFQRAKQLAREVAALQQQLAQARGGGSSSICGLLGR